MYRELETGESLPNMVIVSLLLSLAAAIMGNCLVKGQPIEEAIPIGLQAAYNSLFSSNTVGEIVSNVSEEWINIKPKNIKN